MKLKYYFKAVILFLLLVCIQYSYAQKTSSFGNIYVHAGTEMYIYEQLNFFNSSEGSLPGMIATERTFPQGYVSFFGNVISFNASNESFVDGYVKVSRTGGFIFPIGDNNFYRPILLSTGATDTMIANAAYYAVDPNIAVLPQAAPFPTSALSSNVLYVSNNEYWDINGTPAKITLTWDANSNISSITNQLCLLTIVGWNASTQQWENIPSSVNAISIIDGNTPVSFLSGTITTHDLVDLDKYTVYTFAKTTHPFTITTLVNPSCFQQNNGYIVIENVTGGTFPYTYSFSNGSTTNVAENLSPSTYNVIITDDNNCYLDTSFVITENPEILLTVENPICVDQSPLPQAFVTDDNPAIINPWISSNTAVATIFNGYINALSAGNTVITYTNTFGCTVSRQITVKSKIPPSIIIGAPIQP